MVMACQKFTKTNGLGFRGVGFNCKTPKKIPVAHECVLRFSVAPGFNQGLGFRVYGALLVLEGSWPLVADLPSRVWGLGICMKP